MAQVQYLEQPRTPRYDELVPGFGQTRANSSVFLFEPQARRLTHARWRWESALPWLDRLEVHAGRQFIRDDRRNRDNGAFVEDAERNSVTSDGFTIKAESTFHNTHYLTWGAELYDDTSRIRRDIRNGQLSARPARFPDGSTSRQLGVFAIDDWRVTPAADLIWGLRWTRVETELPPVINGIGTELDDDALSGNIGINYALSDDLRLVANIGRGFRAPNVFDLGTFGDRPGNRFNQPNPNLAPERITTADFGFKFGSDTLSGELIGFRSRFDDKITSVLTGEVLPNGRLVTQSRNITEQDLYGVEAGIDWRLDDRWRTYATATWTRGDEETLGITDPADRVPPLYGKAGAQYAWSDDIDLEGWLMYATSQDRLSPRDRIDPRINPDGTAGWTTFNARIGWTPNANWALALRLENLGDRRYREHGSGLDEPGRNITGIVEYRF
jgi:outer membrane receptor protein involved in Fe transport